MQLNKEKFEFILELFENELKSLLIENGFKNFRIDKRIKGHYSIFIKMQRKGVEIEEILDLMAIRVIVEKEIDCYNVLGLIHLKYKPIFSRFKDYISIPKENGYRSLHTTCFFRGNIIEVQIRTFDMDKEAKYGVAAHLNYKLDLLNEIDADSEKLIENIKNEFDTSTIHVFTPKGEIISLPVGATALDFAYKIHTD